MSIFFKRYRKWNIKSYFDIGMVFQRLLFKYIENTRKNHHDSAVAIEDKACAKEWTQGAVVRRAFGNSVDDPESKYSRIKARALKRTGAPQGISAAEAYALIRAINQDPSYVIGMISERAINEVKQERKNPTVKKTA